MLVLAFMSCPVPLPNTARDCLPPHLIVFLSPLLSSCSLLSTHLKIGMTISCLRLLAKALPLHTCIYWSKQVTRRKVSLFYLSLLYEIPAHLPFMFCPIDPSGSRTLGTFGIVGCLVLVSRNHPFQLQPSPVQCSAPSAAQPHEAGVGRP